MLALHRPGTSALHRCPAIAKLLALGVTVTLIMFLRELWQLGMVLVIVVALFVLARVPWRVAVRSVAPVLWILAIAVPINAIFSGWEHAAVVATRVLSVVALAGLLALTTSVTATLGAVHQLLRPFPRVNADRVGLILALTLRAIPLLAEIVSAVFEARRARGVERSLRAIAVPVIVRALQTADGLGEALIARGADD